MLRADAESLYRGKHRDLSRRLNTETLGVGKKRLNLLKAF